MGDGVKKEECYEFTALAIPNVMGGAMLVYLLGLQAQEAGLNTSLKYGIYIALVVLFCYLNIGKAEKGAAVKNADKEEKDIPPCTCAFIGLGRMGGPMAANLCRTDNVDLRVWNRNGDIANRHAQMFGSKAFASIEEAVMGCDFVFLCLPTTDVVAEVCEKFEKGNFIVIDCTSGEPNLSKKIAASLAERNIQYCDAPVSGGPNGAANATLTMMVGAEKSAFDKIEPVLSAVGRTIIHVGPIGAGHAVKAINNALNASALLMSAEGLLALAKYGVAPETALKVINNSSGRNLQTETRIPEQVLNRKFDFGFSLKLMSKDNNIAASLIDPSLGESSYIKTTASLLKDSLAQFGEDADYTACVKLLEEKTKLKLQQ